MTIQLTLLSIVYIVVSNISPLLDLISHTISILDLTTTIVEFIWLQYLLHDLDIQLEHDLLIL
ncbi:hypothetical protein CR513_06098, partial [Mucuna pruriens]